MLGNFSVQIKGTPPKKTPRLEKGGDAKGGGGNPKLTTKKRGGGGGIETRPGTEKRCSHNLQSGPDKTWTVVLVIINISDRRSTYSK